MARFLVTLADQSTEAIDAADAYQQEGPLTTFFSLQEDRRVIDSWSVRLASFRTADIATIRRVENPVTASAPSPSPVSTSQTTPLLRSA